MPSKNKQVQCARHIRECARLIRQYEVENAHSTARKRQFDVLDDTPSNEAHAKWKAEFFFEYEAEIRMKVIASHTAGIAIANAAKTAINASQSAQRATRHLNRDILGISKEARVKRLFKYLIIVHLIVVALAIAAFNTPYIMKSIQTTPDIYNTTDVSTDKVLVDDSIDVDTNVTDVDIQFPYETILYYLEGQGQPHWREQLILMVRTLQSENPTNLIQFITKYIHQRELTRKLHNAVVEGDSLIVEHLLNAGASPSDALRMSTDGRRWISSNSALREARVLIVKLLIKAGGYTNVMRFEEICRRLQETGMSEVQLRLLTDVNTKRYCTNTPDHIKQIEHAGC